ncbi:DUF3577 domain-containing protein [Pandoraea sp.]|uniref:DUF3577 domain-containing protein n=1 Tax=Pandoraea sp. TaxID=1883445 RepID=UPI001207D243|nr:DUF3577 domain-containing protein [Pandoraea sp.]TAL52749.1 MAG: DUF3577 domain-containing protein [Pandoraea sp.]TAM17729.1 MAG: DUF3577 domain-containing protein [Pandoraea sp.]
MTQANQSTDKIFDCHMTGLGYLSRVREVKPQKGKPFLSCAIAAFHGDASDVTYVYLDLKVVGAKAKEIVALYQDQANDKETRVLVGFKVGDPYIDMYDITKGDRAGQKGALLKGRLLQVNWLKVNGETLYKEVRDETEATANADAAAESEASYRTGTHG